MVELLLDNHVPRIQVVRIVSFVAFLSGEVYFTLSLIPWVSATASSAIVTIIVEVSLRSSSIILLESFRYTVLLEMSYFIASPASNVDAFPWSGSRILLFLLLA